MRTSRSCFRLALTWASCLALRLIPFRAPNIEPILTAQMPAAQFFGAGSGFLFGALSVGAYDVSTGTLGMRTLITATVYGLIGLAAGYYFRHRPANRLNLVLFAAFGTLVYDALTGLTIGPLFWGQPFLQALVGQVPFTALHLFGNILLALTVSPLLVRWFAAETTPVLVLKTAEN